MVRHSMLFALALAAATSISAQAAVLTIENDLLSVHYDDATRTFSVTDKASGMVFLRDGRLDADSGEATVGEFHREVFGSGRLLETKRMDGGRMSLLLFDHLPFLLIRGDLNNQGGGVLDIEKIVPTTFTIDLGTPADRLRALGTAGLTAPDKNPGSYLFLTVAEPATRRGVVTGWLTNDRGSGVCFSEVKDGKVALRHEIQYGHLRLPPPDASNLGVNQAAIETLAVGLFDDARLGQEAFADLIAREHQIKLRPQTAGYCTWYSDKHGAAGDETSIVELAEFAARELKPFGFSFVQIDDQWQDGGEYNGPRRGFDRVKPDGPYPHGMKAVAEKIESLGLTAGIWFMPFARNHQDPEYKDRQDWFVKRQDGTPYETAWGGTSLDLTNPHVQDHLTELIKKIHGWGFNYFKMDGLWTGSATEQIYINDGYRDDHLGNNAPFHDPLKTNIEVFRDGLKLVRRAAGPDVFFSGCNVSQNMRTLGATIGLVDSMRIGPDNGQAWKNYAEEIANPDGAWLITGPIRGTRLYFLHGRVWWNDPDPCYVRSSIPLHHAQLLTSWVALSGQFHLDSDWIPDLPAERLDVLKRTMPAHRATARPIDYFDSILPSLWIVTDARGPVRRDVLGLFNWESSARTLAETAARAGLDPNKRYHAFDFWANEPAGSFQGDFRFDVPAESCRVIAVRAAEGHPVLASTSRHATQGIVDVTEEVWNPALRQLHGTSRVVANDPYELRIAGLEDGGRWRLVSTDLSEADRAAGVAAEAKPAAANEPGWARVGISSNQSRDVRWTLTFEQGQ